MVVENRKRGEALVYVWDREAYPWLMSWEENRCLADKPWDGETSRRQHSHLCTAMYMSLVTLCKKCTGLRENDRTAVG